MIRQSFRIALFAVVASGFTCDAKGPGFFGPGETSPHTGTLAGTVFNGTVPLSGAAVSVSGTGVRSTASGTDGKFNFLDLDVGPYTINTTVPSFICSPSNVMVALDATTTANVACAPVPGRIIVKALRSGTGFAGATVTVNGPVARTATTGADGTSTFSDLPPGQYNISVSQPSGGICEGALVQVTSGATTNTELRCADPTGNLAIAVTLNGNPAPNVGFTVRQDGIVVGLGTTDANGVATVTALPLREAVVSITPPEGATCSPPVTVLIEEGNTRTATFVCTRPPSNITGTVTLNTELGTGVIVTLSRQGSPDVTTSVDLFGRYSFNDVAPGNYSLKATHAGATCTPNPANITVAAGQQATANFSCTSTPNEFSVGFGDPPPSWIHNNPGVSSLVCAGVTTSPAQAGGTWTSSWSGPGTAGSTTRNGTLDANGKAIDRQTIVAFGFYTVTITVTSGGTTRQGNASVTVTSAPGSCPPP